MALERLHRVLERHKALARREGQHRVSGRIAVHRASELRMAWGQRTVLAHRRASGPSMHWQAVVLALEHCSHQLVVHHKALEQSMRRSTACQQKQLGHCGALTLDELASGWPYPGAGVRPPTLPP
jgi:hypothetical protein